jgi:hypothetical protein
MNQRLSRGAQLVFRGWLELSEDDRNAVLRAINDFRSQPRSVQLSEASQLAKSLEIYFGPSSPVCQCCGR